ncbi:hypothetical protein [Sporichthya polymorpha]|uniref:hypothetical protein n=1 Tax=Sporichthya polymorpha TaxID=35751 RepID=UPI0003678BAF|nr:hypothetical protein [Sporichthya polymorpha]
MNTLSTTTQRGMTYCALAFCAVYGTGILLAGFVPPPSPNDSAEEISDFFASNTGRIRTGTLLMMLGGALMIPFFAVLTLQMRRIRGRFDGLALAQLVAGGIAVWVFTLPPIVFAVAAFRPGQNPDVTQMLNDLGWFLFVWNLGTVTCQAVVIAIAIFSDRGEHSGDGEPVFPRWVAYLNVWVAIGFLPGAALTYFKTGIFAWNGVLAFWLAAVLFFSWILVLFWSTLRAVNREAAQAVPNPLVGKEVPA